MNNSYFFENFMRALELPDIRAKICEICTEGAVLPLPPVNGAAEEEDALAVEQTRAEGLKQEADALRNALLEAEQKLGESQKRIAELEQERDKLTDACQTMQDAVQKRERTGRELEARIRKLEGSVAPYQELIGLWERFRMLSGEVGSEAEKFLPREDPICFFAVGCQRETIFRLWDLLCRQCQQREESGEETLLKILAFFLKCYNFNYSAPALELMTGERGQPFDRDRHLRSPSCSMYQGKVERVLLPGIWNRNKSCAERKCLVYF